MLFTFANLIPATVEPTVRHLCMGWYTSQDIPTSSSLVSGADCKTTREPGGHPMCGWLILQALAEFDLTHIVWYTSVGAHSTVTSFNSPGYELLGCGFISL